MSKLLAIEILLWSAIFSFNAAAQSFVNGELNGSVGFENAPTGWSVIPYNDPICQANTVAQATVDILNETGPSLSGGVAGEPHSGSTFCSGLHSTDGTSLWHEGIMQDVNGLTIGESYSISFFQAVVKQTNHIDQSGSWRVYMDDLLIETSIPSTSILAPDDINLQWDNRIMDFVATSTSHTFKFIPWDDDANLTTSETDITGGLRMGIDSINLIVIPPNPPNVDLGNDTILCVGDSLVLDATFSGATYVWQDNSTDSVYTAYQTGTYTVEVSNQDGTATDAIYIVFISAPTVNLGEDVLLCLDDTLQLSAFYPNSSYLWQDSSVASTFEVTQPGNYWVEVTNMCGTTSDMITIQYEDCSTAIEMPNVFTPNNDGKNDFFLPVFVKSIFDERVVILNRWGNEVYLSTNITLGWDGKSNGIDCAEGVYYWIVDYTDLEGNRKSIHGFVQLER